MKITKYIDFYNIAGCEYVINLNNGSFVQLDNESYGKLKNAIKDSNAINKFTAEELKILQDQGFLVNDDFDDKQSLKNKFTYNISKYNYDKESIKIDFALTDKCNFNCPYCFEKDNLCRVQRDNKKSLETTAENLIKYLEILIQLRKIKYIETVLYGGEPTMEKNFIVNFIDRIKALIKNTDIVYKYTFVTNGYLFDQEFISKLKPEDCKFVQITIDGEKEFHNSRRTNLQKINTFDTILNNVNLLVKNKFYTVIRLNVDKTNFESVKSFINNIKKYVPEEYFGNYLSVDVARVFGSETSYDLYEYEDYRKAIADLCCELKLIKPIIAAKDITAFCIAECLSNDLVVDFSGNLYRCWNNVFDEKFKIGNVTDLLKKDCNPYEESNITLNFLENLSLENVNKGKCFECKYIKYCQGLCPTVRENILKGIDKNIYKNDTCKKIIQKRLTQILNYVAKEGKIW